MANMNPNDIFSCMLFATCKKHGIDPTNFYSNVTQNQRNKVIREVWDNMYEICEEFTDRKYGKKDKQDTLLMSS